MRRSIIFLLAPALFACADGQPTAPAAPAPEPDALLGPIGGILDDLLSNKIIYGVDSANRLVIFTAKTPGLLPLQVGITGLEHGEKIVGIDFRPANGELYGLASTNRIYVINPLTGAAAAVSHTPFSPALSGTYYGFDFNPAADRIRVHSTLEQDLRLHPDLGTVVAVDGKLAYAGGDRNAGKSPDVAGTGYTQSDFNGGKPPATTELYAIDSRADVLVELANPNDGQLSTVGSLGVNTSSLIGFDVVGRANVGFAALTDAHTGRSTLYKVDLHTGKAAHIGRIASSAPLVGIAVKP